MKVYIWEDVLRDYTEGMIVVVASSLKEAREAALNECNYLPQGDITKKPTIIDPAKIKTPRAFLVWGGG